jgi:hypothetical protein
MAKHLPKIMPEILKRIEEAKVLYLRTGFCKHEFLDTCEPPNCGLRIVNCMVCAKEISRVHNI